MTTIMASAKLAKYEHAYADLVQRIKDGRYPVGGRMPTEEALARHFAISRVTIRRALDILVQEGYLERKQGSGYTVLTLSPASDTCLSSFTDAMLRAGLEPVSRFLSLELFNPSDSQLNGVLPAGFSELPITRVTRLRLVSGEPKMIVQTYVPTRFMRDASSDDFPERGPDQSILRILRSRFKLDWSAACEDIYPIAADEKTALLLNVAVHQPLLQQSCSAFDEHGEIVFYENVFRTGSVSFNLTQQSRRAHH